VLGGERLHLARQGIRGRPMRQVRRRRRPRRCGVAASACDGGAPDRPGPSYPPGGAAARPTTIALTRWFLAPFLWFWREPDTEGRCWPGVSSLVCLCVSIPRGCWLSMTTSRSAS
jgi:hypothetical protein